MSVINDLYNGKIYPFEEIVSRNKEYQKINEKISEIRKYFIDKMSSEDIENFIKLEELIHEANSMDTYENFSYGLRLGIMLAFEIFTEYKQAETN